MKQFKPVLAILSSIAIILVIILMSQCAPTPKNCNLPAPQTVRIDSFRSNGQAYISWTQVAGNNGYRIRVIEVDSPPSVSALRDTSVEINDTNIVITNLPINTLLEFQVYAKCTNDSSSVNYGFTRRSPIVIADECPMIDGGNITPLIKKPCDTLTRNKSFQVENPKALINSFTINKFIQKPKRHYHIKIMDGNKIVTDFLLIKRTSTYEVCSNCGENPPKLPNYNERLLTFEWKEPKGSGKIRLIIDDKTNSIILQTDLKRSYTIESSSNFGERQ